MGKSSNGKDRNGQEVAIIGMAGRFPGARNIDEFWRNIRDGVESISFFADSDLIASGIDAAMLNDPNYVKAGGSIEDIDMFDAGFFGYSPREAEIMDPQHRLFLECSWEALENAGYDSDRYKGLIGVYAGTGMSTYLVNIFSNPQIVAAVGGFQIGIGNNKDHLTTRISYKLGLEGPAITVQTACSSSLVAIHLACQALLGGECDMALSGGVTIEVPQKAGYYYQEGGILSPDGHCRAFDAKARGTVGGNGVGIVVLKRLEDAIEDRDTVYAIIKGSAINNDGSLKVGYTAPRVEGQAQVIKAACEVAEVEPETITYVEAHGTGTELGDPIEVAALTRAFGARTQKKGYCALGSVKTNIGHLDTASGVASLIKAVLALKHGQIPPSLNYEEANPQIDFGETPFYVNSKLKDWETGGELRRAGVSSFGIGGTNAHVVLEEMREEVEGEQKVEGEERQQVREPGERGEREWKLVVMSGQSEEGLERVTERLCEHLSEERGGRLEDIAYTLQVGRRRLSHRRVVVCSEVADAVEALRTRDARRVFTTSHEPTDRAVVFMFPGQGAQYVNMGLGLYEGEPTFREQVDLCSGLLRPHLGLDLREILYPGGEADPLASERLTETRLSQPAIFVIEYALARMWMEWGISPHALIGHSVGEYVAACLAGVFSLPDALSLISARGRLMQQQPGGEMLSVAVSESELEPLLGEQLSLAAVNGPSLCVVSGTAEAVSDFERLITERGVTCRHLQTSHAFHSKMMDAVLEPFSQHIATVKLSPPAIPYLSSLTGTWITEREATDPGYWVRQLRQPVRFSEGLEAILKEPDWALLEVGPGQTLSTLAKRHPKKAAEQLVLPSLRHPDENASDAAFVLKTLGRLWLAGTEINWNGFHAHQRRHRVALPTYPFERQRYWIEAQPFGAPVTDQHSPIKKIGIDQWYYVPSWKRTVTPVAPDETEPGEETSPWLVFLDQYGLGSEIAGRLDELGRRVITVKAGENFRRAEDGAFEIRPAAGADYEMLLKSLAAEGNLPRHVIHLWSVGEVTNEDDPGSNFARWQERGFYSLLFLAQAFAREAPASPATFQVISNYMQEVIGGEALSPDKATLLGPCKVVPQEYPNITCRSIDIDAGEVRANSKSRSVEQLMGEITLTGGHLVVAYRGIHRWVQSFEPLTSKEMKGGPARLRVEGVYLITGGLGLIGLTCAQYLAETLQAKLVLVGRSPFPEKETWGEYEAVSEADDEVRRKISRLQGMQEAGAEVWVYSADVGDEAQMREVIERTCERHGRIDGVIHAAGVIGDSSVRSIQETGREELESQARAKVEGALVLKKLLQHKDLDFVMLMSSLSSALGGLGSVAYSAVNLYLDAFAHAQNQAGSTTWISVDWDGWRVEPDDQPPGLPIASDTRLGLTPQEGAEVFRRVLSLWNVSQVIISTADLQARINQWINLESVRDETPVEQKVPGVAHTRPSFLNDFVAPNNELEASLARIWQELLGIDQIGVEDNFFDLGGHSLLAIQIISRIRETFRIEIPMRSLFEAPTIAGLAQRIETVRWAAHDMQSPMSAGDEFQELEV